jgi:hypothetical protein
VLAVDTATEKVEWLAVLKENIAVANGKRLRATVSTDKRASNSPGGQTGKPIAGAGAAGAGEADDGGAFSCLGCGHSFGLPPGVNAAEACPKCFSNFIVQSSS